MQLDEIVSGRTEFRAVIDGIAEMANQLIEVLQRHPGRAVDLGLSTALKGRGRRKPRVPRGTSKNSSGAKPSRRRRSSKPGRSMAATDTDPPQSPSSRTLKTNGSAPTAKMVAYAKSLAGKKSVKLPPGYDQDFATCRRFLDQHA